MSELKSKVKDAIWIPLSLQSLRNNRHSCLVLLTVASPGLFMTILDSEDRKWDIKPPPLSPRSRCRCSFPHVAPPRAPASLGWRRGCPSLASTGAAHTTCVSWREASIPSGLPHNHRFSPCKLSYQNWQKVSWFCVPDPSVDLLTGVNSASHFCIVKGAWSINLSSKPSHTSPDCWLSQHIAYYMLEIWFRLCLSL